MNDGFIAKPLEKRQIDQAFPVVRAILPDLAVERWRAFAAALLDGAQGRPAASVVPAGIMTVQNGHGYIHGLFSYSAHDHLHHGRILTVENFVVLDLFNLSGAAAALLRAMDTLARGLDCSAIHTSLPDSFSKLPEYCGTVLSYFRDQGHAVETLRLCKALDGANDNMSHPLNTMHDADRRPPL